MRVYLFSCNVSLQVVHACVLHAVVLRHRRSTVDFAEEMRLLECDPAKPDPRWSGNPLAKLSWIRDAGIKGVSGGKMPRRHFGSFCTARRSPEEHCREECHGLTGDTHQLGVKRHQPDCQSFAVFPDILSRSSHWCGGCYGESAKQSVTVAQWIIIIYVFGCFSIALYMKVSHLIESHSGIILGLLSVE